MIHPLHEHSLELIDQNIVYAQYEGHWSCNNCEKNKPNTEVPYHCSLCSFDICRLCLDIKRHIRHEHPLYYTNMKKIFPQYQGVWKCDACGETKGPPTNTNAYHCYQDQFDLCEDCYQGRLLKVHQHLLVPADTSLVYELSSQGSFRCDVCGGENLGTKFSWHCSPCQFDCCEECRRDIRLSEHEHPLSIRDSFEIFKNTGAKWKCDVCHTTQNPVLRTSDPTESRARYPYHCDICHQFDACQSCASGYDVTGPGITRQVRLTSFEPSSVKQHIPPVEILEENISTEGLAESDICSICFQRPKTATILHQGTGHNCCCMRCGFEIWNRDGRCPICRQNIDSIVRTYTT